VSCYRPLPAHRDRQGGAVRIGYKDDADPGDKLELPCGRCIGCRLDRARTWSVRISHEASLYDSNLFVTLDYAPKHLPASLSLEYPDFQWFMKRLRKELDGASVAPDGRRPIRFFCAGEYGSKFQRPHWHAILFNLRMEDRVRFQNGTYRSELLETLWGKGNAVIGEVTPRSAAYVAGYTLSKVYGRPEAYEDVVNLRTGELSARRPEFVVMSRRPGIGFWWWKRYAADLFPADHAIQEGKAYKVPRYYWNRFREEGDPSVVEEVAYRRFLRARAVPASESSDERRAVREEVTEARSKLYGERSH